MTSTLGIRWSHTLLLLSLMAMTAILAQRDWLWRWDLNLYDASMPLLVSESQRDVVIVAVDETSLARLGRWPWSRRSHAALVDVLSDGGARAILLDMIFAEPDLRDPGADEALAKSLKDSARVVLPVLLEQPQAGGQLLEQMPLPLLTDAAARLGHAHAELDADGVSRSTYLLEGLGSPRWPTLALAMLWVGDRDQVPDLESLQVDLLRESTDRAWARAHHVLVPFIGNPGSVHRVSYADVLEGRFPKDAFRDAYVLVGVTATGLGDTLPTPVSGHGQPMPGVEFNANLLHALRGDGVITKLATSWRVVLCALFVAVPLLAYSRLGPRTALIVAVVTAVAVVVIAALVLVFMRVWIAPAPALVGVLVSYPLWSWLRLESAMGFLRREWRRTEAMTSALSHAPEAELEATAGQLMSLLPVSGWWLQDAHGKRVHEHGESTDPPLLVLAPGRWRQSATLLQLGLNRAGENYQLIGIWIANSPIDEFQKQLVERYAARYREASSSVPRDSMGVVQAHIARLQHANEELSQLRGIVDDAFAQMADAVLVTDNLAQVRFANPQAARYLRDDEHDSVVGSVLTDVLEEVRPEGGAIWKQVLGDVLLRREARTITARNKSGRDLLVELVPIQGGDLTAGGAIVTAADISHWKDRERQREEMLSFLSHDLRSPLVSMLAVLQLDRARRENAASPKSMDEMERLTRTTLHLAEQFLELVRAESKEELARSDTDMIAIASNALDQVWAQADRKNIRIERVFRVDEAWIQAEGALIERAIANLLGNAVVHNPEGTDVRIEVDCVESELTVVVSDNGRGIPTQERAWVFRRFAQGKGASGTARPAGGSGLGLAFVQVVCERHAARVSLHSQEGEGSRFILRFPGCDCRTDG